MLLANLCGKVVIVDHSMMHFTFISLMKIRFNALSFALVEGGGGVKPYGAIYGKASSRTIECIFFAASYILVIVSEIMAHFHRKRTFCLI